MAEKASLLGLIHKEVPLKFDGASLRLALSQALFSSHAVDQGSLLLLKTLAQKGDLSQVTKLLDWGCGVGTLGLALKKRYPDLDATLIDRQVLATEFADRNAGANGLEVVVQPGVGHFGIKERFDLVATNWPAKAGEPVLANFIQSIGHNLSPQGYVAMVIVAPLWEDLLALVMQNGAKILHKESTPQYGVLHFRPQAQSPCNPQAFIRNRGTYKSKIAKYSLETVYGLGSFDSLSHEEELLSTELGALESPLAFWEPGQGHLPLLWCKGQKARPASLTLASGDLLSLWISQRNLQALGQRTPELTPLGISHFADLAGHLEPGSFRALVAPYRPIPGTQDLEAYWQTAQRVLGPSGLLLCAGKSAQMHRLLAKCSGFHTLKDKKKKGLRLVLLKKDRSPL
jgi:hypothetical protein